jgi:uncharacterized membrane protein YukC
MIGINQVLAMCWSIAGRTNDEKVRLQALALINQCNTHKMDMVTNGAIITGALTYVNGKTRELGSAAEKKPLQNGEGEESKESEEPDYGEEEELEEEQEKDTGELEEEEEKTTNDVF